MTTRSASDSAPTRSAITTSTELDAPDAATTPAGTTNGHDTRRLLGDTLPAAPPRPA
ncbi:hypothetical protein [Frankia sp. AgB32]|uniref:hypothetical protein n=1 Tax=Frankia sp. AgB32 TaxID=631119 RepID=UPI0024B18DED